MKGREEDMDIPDNTKAEDISGYTRGVGYTWTRGVRISLVIQARERYPC